MLIVIDIGNSQTAVGLFGEEGLVNHWRFETLPGQTADEKAVQLSGLLGMVDRDATCISAVCAASVVPAAETALIEMSTDFLKIEPLVVGPGIKTGITVEYDRPETVGADRLANAVSGIHKFGGPLIIVDFGTATTFDVISKDAAYLGGAIAPGVETSAHALFRSAAKLSGVALREPGAYLGRDTHSSLTSGIIYGAAAMVDGLVTGIRRELQSVSQVVATGGLVDTVAPHCSCIDHVEPFLTLEGLRRIWLINQDSDQ